MTTDPADCGTDRLNNDESVQDDKSITEDDAKSINNDKSEKIYLFLDCMKIYELFYSCYLLLSILSHY